MVLDAMHGLQAMLLVCGSLAGDADLLAAALGMLEAEFRRLLADHSAPLAMKETDSSTPASVVPSRIPASVVHKLGLILDRLAANGRLDRCSAAYADARGDTVGASLRALGLDYLKETSEDAQTLSPSVERWGRHLEFAVHHLLEAERKLCVAVFERRPEAMPSCFAQRLRPVLASLISSSLAVRSLIPGRTPSS